MKWDQSNYGAHTEKAITGPASNWFFAEGSQGFFLTYVLLTNPSTSQNRASVRFLRESGGPIVQEFTLAPLSRRTVDCGAIAALVNTSFGIEVTFLDAPGAAERAMYFGLPPDRLFKAGHESAGVTAPSTEWFLAEGATGRFFETFVLIANPNASAANVTLTYVTETGAMVTRNKTVPGQRPHHGEHRGGGLAGAGQRRGGDPRAVEHPGGGGAGAVPGPLPRRCGSRRTTPLASPPPARGGAWPRARSAGSSRRTASSCSPTTRTPRRR